jgi:uncharacterized BrkB/YihY/UPF0761 family membrane protein
MNFQKIIKILAMVVGVLSIIFLVRIIGAGDEELKAAAEAGDTGFVDGYLNPISYVAYIVIGLTVVLVLLFSLINIVTHPKVLKTTITNVGAFAVVAAIAYFGFANGVETPMRDGEVLSASGSKLVGAGLYLFYFLAIIAGGAMLFTGVKKMIK